MTGEKMTEDELDRLLAMLEPSCEERTLEFVKKRLLESGAVHRRRKISPAQTIDPFESPCANDPVGW